MPRPDLGTKVAIEVAKLNLSDPFAGSPLTSPVYSNTELNKLPGFTWDITTPVVGGRPGPYLYVDKNLVQIDAEVVGTGSVTFNVEVRTSMGAPDTELLIDDIIATSTKVQVTTFATDVLPQGKRFWLHIKAVTGSVSVVGITVTTTGGNTTGTTGGNSAGSGNVSDTGATAVGHVAIWMGGANSHIIGDGGIPLGDMDKATYDTDNDGIVDHAAEADTLTGITVVTSVGSPGSDSNIPTEKAIRTAIGAGGGGGGDATSLQGTDIDSSLAPTDGQVLEWVDGDSQWESKDIAITTTITGSDILSSSGAAYTLSPTPSSSYPDPSLVKLADGVLGSTTFNDGKWVGWLSVNPSIVIDLGANKLIHTVRFNFLSDPPTGIHTPTSMIVSGSVNNSSFTQIGSYVVTTDWATETSSTVAIWSHLLVTAGGSYRYIKFEITGFGQWTFLSEFEVYTINTSSTVPLSGLSLVDVVDTPGLDTNIPTEKAVRDAIGSGGGGGGGDVSGPSVAVDGNLAVFDGTTGKILKDGGAVPSGGGGGSLSWTAPTLLNGWTNYVGYDPAGYVKDNDGFVHLKGLIQSGAGDVFVLPTGCRPTGRSMFVVFATGSAGRMDVLTDGTVTFVAGTNTYVSLDGIEFATF
jgi:hypothetical protein